MHYTYLRAGILASEGQLQSGLYRSVELTGPIDEKLCRYVLVT